LDFGEVFGGDQQLDGLGDLGRGLDLEIVGVQFDVIIKIINFLTFIILLGRGWYS
jgi:hypothetical protein